MTPDPDLADWFHLTSVPGLGPRTLRRLLAELGLPGAVLAARILGVRPDASALLDWASREGNAVLTLADAAYPAQLLEVADPPALLYVRGDVSLLGRSSSIARSTAGL
jgi:DNA processing protein